MNGATPPCMRYSAGSAVWLLENPRMNLLYYLYGLCLLIMTGARGARVVVSLYALDLGASPLAVGMLAASFSLMPVLLAWPVGRWADRAGARWPMVVGALGATLSMLLPFFFHTLPVLFIAALLNGAGFIAFNVAQQNTVGNISSPETRTRNFSNLTLMISLGNLFGPLLGGFAIDHSGHATACLSLALCSTVCAVAVLCFGGGLPQGSGMAPKSSGKLVELMRNPALVKVLLIAGLVIGSTDMFHIYMPIYTHGLGISASTIGVILACYAAASFLVRTVLSRFLERATVEEVLTRCFLLAGGILACIPFVHNVWLLCALSFLFGFGISVGQPITMMLSYANAADGRSGEVIGLRQSVQNLTQVFSPTVFGSVGTLLGVLSVFMLNSVLLLGGALLIRTAVLTRKPGGKLA